MADYQILLYYKYTQIENPQELTEAQRQLCQSLGLKGRLIIGSEGINGTLEGTTENTEAYVTALVSDPRFSDVHMKRSLGTGSSFPKLSVKFRNEIVSAHLGEADINPSQFTAPYIQAEELHAWIHSDKEFYIVDMRNDYEHVVGHFAQSILPPMANFRDLPSMLPALEHLKDKVVVTVCTGGVRCEKASGFLLTQGFKEVYQLYGGIVTYMERYPNEDFHGQLYVFDGRITMGFNLDDPTRTIVGRCERCGAPSERYINCANLSCHRHFICCQDCDSAAATTFCGKNCLAPVY